EGFQGDRRHQQGRGSADLPNRGLRPCRRPVRHCAGADRKIVMKDEKKTVSFHKPSFDDGVDTVMLARPLAAIFGDLAQGARKAARDWKKTSLSEMIEKYCLLYRRL